MFLVWCCLASLHRTVFKELAFSFSGQWRSGDPNRWFSLLSCSCIWSRYALIIPSLCTLVAACWPELSVRLSVICAGIPGHILEIAALWFAVRSQTQTCHLLFLKVRVSVFCWELEIKSCLQRAFLEGCEEPWSVTHRREQAENCALPWKLILDWLLVRRKMPTYTWQSFSFNFPQH